MIRLRVNGQTHELDVDPAMPLLWAIRENLALTGTKFGCGISQCGACTVHLNGQPVRSCVTPVAAAAGAEITTIEGLAAGAEGLDAGAESAAAGAEQSLHAVQTAWIEKQVPQCGYCQSGQIMSAAALLADNPDPDDEAINQAMSGNLCRCGMYSRIRAAIKHAAKLQGAGVQTFDPAVNELVADVEVQHG